MSNKEFFEQENCGRCNNRLTARTTSWFNTETICIACSVWEDVIIDHRQESKSELEAIGTIPEVEIDIRWGEDVPDELDTK